MKSIKIYGESYVVEDSPSGEVDLYYYNKDLHEEPLNRYPAGYIKLDDGTCVGIYTSSKKLIIIPLVAMLVVGLGVGGFFAYKEFRKPKSFEGTMLKVSTTATDSIVFNGMPQSDGTKVDLRYKNGSSPATVSIEGEGIESQQVQVGAGEELAELPITMSSDSDVIEATLKVTTESNEYTYPMLIEVPSNMPLNAGGDASDVLITGDDNPFGGEVIVNP